MIKKKKKSSGTGCVQRFVDIKYLTGSILGTLNSGILKLIDAIKYLTGSIPCTLNNGILKLIDA